MLAKSKLNSIENLVSQTLIETSHEKFTVTFKEKDKYDKMKKNLRNVSEKLEGWNENMRLNIVNSSFSTYKMCPISAEGYKNAKVYFLRVRETIKFGQAWKM